MDDLRSGVENMWLSDDDFIIDSSDDESNELKEYHCCVLSLDIGIKNLGLSVTLLNDDYTIMEIIWIDLIDIQIFAHNVKSEKECKLNHTKTFCDWMNHVFQENMIIFERADIILIERQPPMGLVGIEQLIFSRWRKKSVLISPNSMHKFFHIGHYDYEQRKEQTNKISYKYIENNSNLCDKFGSYKRSHDIADSICMMLFWISRKQKEFQDIKRKEKLKTMVYDREQNGYKISVDEYFEQFRYRGKYS
jgi:hypothetical protein